MVSSFLEDNKAKLAEKIKAVKASSMQAQMKKLKQELDSLEFM